MSTKKLITRVVGRILKNKLSIEEFRIYCSSNILNVKPDNIDFNEKYDVYIKTFNNQNNMEQITLNDIGFYTNLNGGKCTKYLKSRGWEQDDINIIFSNAYKKQRANMPNYDSIKKSFGSSNVWQSYVDKINTDTGKCYTEEEARLVVYKKQSTGGIGLRNKIQNGYSHNIYEINFWTEKGLNKNEAYSRIVELRTKTGFASTLNGYIERYGNIDGTEKFKIRQEKWQKTLNSKSDEEKIDILKRKTKKLPIYSKQSILFFDELIKVMKYGSNDYKWKDDEIRIYDEINKRIYFYDFCIIENKIIIEFNGTHCHPSPRLTESEKNEWKCPYTKRSYYEVIEYHITKKETAINKGFELIEIWTDIDLKEQLNNIILKIKK